jgi:predicted RNA methylase
LNLKNDFLLESNMTHSAKDSKFMYLLGKDHIKWTCSDESYLAYITPDIIIQKIIELAREHFNGLTDKVIWDMFSGIGSDGLRLAIHSGKVICTEINPLTFHDLKENFSIWGCDNIELFNEDCSKSSVDCDIIYFDPPWGSSFRSGASFDFKDVTLYNGTSVLDLAAKMQENHHMIIKSPISSDSFEELFAHKNIRLFTFTQQKLKFLFIKNESL